ncbi:MAG: hypothetical protein JSW58_02305 [Candidatus Latescibacterota bacterium]|nr:MAG: hypothetical protein JSW58_02305 [Candidatus Latescibacterota bacterium]
MSKHRFQKSVYNGFILPIAYGLAQAASVFRPKLRESLAGRMGFDDRWKSAGEEMTERPVWFHVASVGEYEQARPLITTLNETRPEIPAALSFASPSGLGYARKKENLDGTNNLRFIDYLPIDFIGNIRFCLASLDPRLLVFVKFDLWPNLVWEAAARGVPLVLIDATLSETSNRYSVLARGFYRAVYEKLDKILAISDLDAQRFEKCVPGHRGISVVGDTRFDRVMERKNTTQSRFSHIDRNNRLVVIAGSTWPKDESHLLGALARVAKANENLLLIVAPHEPIRGRVRDLLGWADANGLRATTLRALGQKPPHGAKEQVIIVDSVGVLAEMYELADVAYVGGSFSTGVHNVIEPAIMGIPVVFGPVHKNSFEAIELLNRRAAIEVENERDIFDTLSSLLEDHDVRNGMGRRAMSYVESQLGATDRCFQAISEYL